ncbi:phosphohydrolase [Mangrovivirga cuniculi]|uniref:Phosphohydrolase n=2 Tax=Mangrovivirga cuniculi TaxID=2715131 RepID=A0A4D7KBZ2_9BACT|nr:phosphohydrolase [Mangrovivirga cuniculi]
MTIDNESQLRDIYGFPSGRASIKDIASLDKHSINFISKSPFAIISTCSKSGKLDASPRGGEPGFVKISNNNLLIPDYKGNNRLDSLVNITETNRIGLLFLIPGIDETLRVNGKASITISPTILNKFNTESKTPKTCIVVEIEELLLHCAKALMRSKLWDISAQINPEEFPSMGKMLKDQLKSESPAESRQDMINRYRKDL